MKTLVQQRSKLYFDRYRYSLSFSMPASYAMRSLSQRFIHNMFVVHHIKHRGVNKRWNDPGVQSNYDNCVHLCNLLLGAKTEFKRTCYYSSQNIYSNDLDWLTTLGELSYVRWPEIREASVTLPRDRVQLRNSKHAYRSYFRERVYSAEEKTLMRNFLLSRTDYFRITPKLISRLGGDHFYDQPTGYDFIDHSSEHDVLMLTMIVPNCIKKTVPIEVVDK
jgi:hypothetical protein